ncbi:tetratricopeptide repeat protein [Patescibacteria group bacterium]|nr:tetratricopeptide repeat protein [Patescibacteria group bacterium]
MTNTALLAQLEEQAIQAAKTQNWETAVTVNQQLIEENEEDIQAYIRLGVAQVQLGKVKEAKRSFTQALELDKSNQLAKKHLQKLENNQTITLSTLPADEQFIEEPGKTKTVELHRLAGREQLEHLSVGQVCELKTKNRFISVEVNKVYIGSLPEDLSSRLTKLMKGGNVYVCYIRSISPTNCTCTVFIKEVSRSAEQEFVNSFPVSKSSLTAINEMYSDDNYTFEIENIPLQIVETDNDEERGATDAFPIDDEDHREEPEENDRDNNDNDSDN